MFKILTKVLKMLNFVKSFLTHQTYPDDFSWQNLNAEINRMGFDAKSLVSIVIATDADNSSRR